VAGVAEVETDWHAATTRTAAKAKDKRRMGLDSLAIGNVMVKTWALAGVLSPGVRCLAQICLTEIQ
jgi:hypothetical protein